jgi:phytoene dehydrogenase-like protein
MARGNQAVLAAVARRLQEAPEQVLPTLRLLADPDALPARLDPSAVRVAKRLNAQRLQECLDDFRARAHSTAEVRELLGGVSRQAVASRVASGSLMSLEIAGRSWFPAWQFGPEGPWPRLPEVLSALLGEGRGVLAADALVRQPIPEESGRAAADLLAAGRVDDVLHYVRGAGL